MRRSPALAVRRRGAGAALRVGALLTALIAGAASAQGGGSTGTEETGARLVAVHFQVLPPSAGPFRAEVSLPPPRLGAWGSVTSRSDAACLRPLAVRWDDAAGHLVLELGVGGETGPALGRGEACTGTVVLTFEDGASVDRVSVGLAFHRPGAPAYSGTRLRSSYAVDRMGRGPYGPDDSHPPAPYMELTVANEGDAAVTVVGFPALAELRRLGFEAFALPSEGVPGSLEGLEPISAELGVELAPGGSLRVAVVVDPAATLSQDAGAAAVQPALLVEEDGRTYTVRFDAVTALWGVD